jgi:hypothetical protein
MGRKGLIFERIAVTIALRSIVLGLMILALGASQVCLGFVKHFGHSQY